MRLRSNIIPFIPYKENYCHLLNITNAILGITTQVEYYEKIPCENQPKNIICDNINKLFSNVIILSPPYVKVIDVLNRSLTNTLDCNNTIIPDNNSYELSGIIILMIIGLIIIRFFNYKLKQNIKNVKSF
jgi:hypothetical protein